ncbi:MAG: CAP domain-containing protein [Syntrophobacteraceae bacterium]
MNLFDDVSHRMIVQNLVRNQRGSLLVTGRVPVVEDGKVILIIQGTCLSGTVSLRNQVYQIRPTGSNLHLVREIRKNDAAGTGGVVSNVPPLDQKIIELVNKERLIEGLKPLHYNSKLSMAARNYAEDMALNNHFGHTRRDGRKFYQMLFETGYPVSVCGENLAVGFTAPEEVFEGWISSPGHRVNILNPAFTEIGVGHATGMGIRNSKLHYWAQNFGGATRPQLSPSTKMGSNPHYLSFTRLFSSDVPR